MKKDSLLPKRCERLRELRGSKTQKEIATLLDVTEKTYRSWENGEYRKGRTEKVYPQPNLERLIKMSDIFHCSIDYLLCRSDCTSVDNHYISLKTGLSETAINKLQETKMYNDAILNNPALPFISILLEQLDPINYNDILHEIAAYLRSNGLNEDMWYNVESKALYYKEYNRGKDFNFPIHAHSEMFDNLLLMDIQERLKNLKRQIKKEVATNTD